MGNEKPENKPKQLMEALGTPERPVSPAEFRAFWQTLSEAEKEEFRNADLT